VYADPQAGVARAQFLSAQQHSHFSSGEFHGLQEHFGVRELFEVLIIQIAQEGSGVSGSVFSPQIVCKEKV